VNRGVALHPSPKGPKQEGGGVEVEKHEAAEKRGESKAASVTEINANECRAVMHQKEYKQKGEGKRRTLLEQTSLQKMSLRSRLPVCDARNVKEEKKEY